MWYFRKKQVRDVLQRNGISLLIYYYRRISHLNINILNRFNSVSVGFNAIRYTYGGQCMRAPGNANVRGDFFDCTKDYIYALDKGHHGVLMVCFGINLLSCIKLFGK